MAITASEAARLAGLLPDDLVLTNARERLLVVAEICRTLTDARHALSNADIRAIIAARFGEARAPAENTLAADIRAIAHAHCLGLELEIGPTGVRAVSRRLPPSRVRMLLNAVQAARYLTYEQAAELQEDLFELVSRHEEDVLAGEVFVERRVRTAQVEVFDTIDVVSRAMRDVCKIEFTYTYLDFLGHPQPLAGDDGTTLRVETPIALYYSQGNYYVETYTTCPWRHGLNLIVCRADRMINTVVSKARADTGPEVKRLRRTARERLESSVDMISGPVCRIFLRVRSDATNYFFDQFGFGHEFCLLEGTLGTPTATALTTLVVPPTVTFFRWLAAVSPAVTVVEPPSALALSSEPLVHLIGGATRDELLRDYHVLIDAYLTYLDRARAPYTVRTLP